MTSSVNAYSIQHVDERDERLIAQIRSFDSGSTFLQPEDPDHLTSVVAVSNNRVIGAARLYRLSIHPTRWRLAILVDREFRRRDIGTALFHACQQALHSGDEIQAGVSSSDEDEVAFLTSVGFSTLMTTYLGQLLRHNIPVTDIIRQPTEITTLAANPELRQDISEIHEQVYRAQHTWSPVGHLTVKFRESVFLDPDELLPDAQFVAKYDGQVVGIASLRAPFSIQSLELGWVGVVDTIPDSTKNEIHAQLLNACLQFARQQGADIFVEIDESDAKTLEVFQSLNVDWESQWLNLVKAV